MITHDTVADVTRYGISGERTFTMSASGKGFSIVIDKLYSNKVAAVVRELCCNARDSHVQAGKAHVPIIITIPNAIDHNFVVRDEGTGLSPEDVHRYLGGIFESTKENSNDYVGTYGLGSKSPFALTDSYTIESRFNGVKYTFMAFRNERKEPALLMTGEEPTDDVNGITFSVPVSDYSTFEREIMNELMFFETLPTFTNRNNFEWIGREVLEENDFGMMVKLTGNFRKGNLCALMGGVVYPIEESSITSTTWEECGVSSNVMRRINKMVSFGHGKAVFLKFNLGDLDVQPSREGLSYDEATKKNIVLKLAEFIAAYDIKVVEAIDSKTTYVDAFKELKRVLANDQYMHESPCMQKSREFPNFPSLVKLGAEPTITLNYHSKRNNMQWSFPFVMGTKTYESPDPDDENKTVTNTLKYKVPKYQVVDVRRNYKSGTQYSVNRKSLSSLVFHLDTILGETESIVFVVADEWKHVQAKLAHNIPEDKRMLDFYLVEVNPEYVAMTGCAPDDVSEIKDMCSELGLNGTIHYVSKMQYEKKARSTRAADAVVRLDGVWKLSGQGSTTITSVKDTSEIPDNPVIVLTEGMTVHFNGKIIEEDNNTMPGLCKMLERTGLEVYQIQKSGLRHLKHFEAKGAIYLSDYLKQYFNDNHLSPEYRESRRIKNLLTKFNRINTKFLGMVRKAEPKFSLFQVLDAHIDQYGDLKLPHQVTPQFKTPADRLYDNLFGGSAKVVDYRFERDDLAGLKDHREVVKQDTALFNEFNFRYGRLADALLSRYSTDEELEYCWKVVEAVSKVEKYKEKYGEI